MTASKIAAQINSDFREFVAGPGFSCLAGKGVVRGGEFRLGIYGDIASCESTRDLARDLREFLVPPARGSGSLRAMGAVFTGAMLPDEIHFERGLWEQLQQLHELDDTASDWDPSVADDPADPRFAFSFAGVACFVIGMHPHSSRVSRRFRYPAIVFNPHSQFDRLREAGTFERLCESVRDRELAIQGSINPNLADFGTQSEARQYSGRAVEPEWRCPFHRKSK